MPKDFKEKLLHRLNASGLSLDMQDERVLKEVSLLLRSPIFLKRSLE